MLHKHDLIRVSGSEIKVGPFVLGLVGGGYGEFVTVRVQEILFPWKILDPYACVEGESFPRSIGASILSN